MDKDMTPGEMLRLQVNVEVASQGRGEVNGNIWHELPSEYLKEWYNAMAKLAMLKYEQAKDGSRE